MSTENTEVASSNTIAGLPVPPREKLVRWFGHGAVAASAVGIVLLFMPYVNKALGLLLTGMLTFAQLAGLFVGLIVAGFAALSFWPVYKRAVESAANRATWAVFEYDPVTPMMLWLKEVRQDAASIEREYENVGAVIAQNEQVVQDDLDRAAQGDRKFAQAVKQYGRDSSEAQLASIEPGTLRETAERIKKRTQGLYDVQEILKQVVQVTQFTEAKAEADVEAFRQELAAAESIGSATASANRVLRGRSERKQNAIASMKIIHDKYAGNFGRLRNLRELSRQAIEGVDLQKGVYHQEALERLKEESRFITAGHAPELIEAQPAATALPGQAAFYRLPAKAK